MKKPWYSRQLSIGDRVIKKTTGQHGFIFQVFPDHLGPGHHAYLIWRDGGRRPHVHDKFMRCDFKLER